MSAVKSIVAIASLLLLAIPGQASAQAPNPAPRTALATNELPKAAPAAKPFPTFAATLGDTTMAIPYFSNHCGPDEQFAPDREWLNGVQTNLQPDQILLGLTMNCQTLERLRANEKIGFSFVAYFGTTQAIADREQAARIICDKADASATLTKTTQAERAQELQALSVNSTTELSAPIGASKLACFVGLTNKIDNRSTALVLGMTAVKNKFVAVMMTSVDSSPLPVLLKDANRLVTQITSINDAQ